VFPTGITRKWEYIKPTLEIRTEDKLDSTMPYEEEADRVCEVKCLKG
jgi:hypothetical protein